MTEIVYLCLYHWKPAVPEAFGFQVCLSVSLCFRKTLWIPYLENQWREFNPILVTDVFELHWLDFGVKGQGHNSWWPRKMCECNIFVTIRSNLTKIKVTYVPGPGDILIRFLGQRSRSQQAYYCWWQPVIEFHIFLPRDAMLAQY